MLCLSFSMYDKLSNPHCDRGTPCPREDLHFEEAHSLPKLDRRANKRYELRTSRCILFVWTAAKLWSLKTLSVHPQSSMLVITGGSVWRSTSPSSFSVPIMKKGLKSDGEFLGCLNFTTNKCTSKNKKSRKSPSFPRLNPSSANLNRKIIFVCRSCRQCALSALNDVRQYLSVEGGQVAVSPVTIRSYSFILRGAVLMVSSRSFRYLMPQTRQETEE